jgi:Skp family chaperone for outer membrane proteins
VKKTRTFLLALAAFGGMLLLIDASQAQAPGSNPPPNAQPNQTSLPPNRATIAVFNMAAVMKEYGKAKYQVYMLTEERKQMMIEVADMKKKATKLQQDMQSTQDPKIKDSMAVQVRDLARMMEDKERDNNKKLNEKANEIISVLYDEIKSVVDQIATLNGYHIVFAYPDATSAEELRSAYVKELKLKPPAAQPFYIAKQVDITNVVVVTLNNWYQSPPVPNTATGSTLPPGTPALPGAGQPQLPPVGPGR